MVSTVQQKTVNREDLGTSGFRKWQNISLVSPGGNRRTWQKHGKNSKKTARRTTSAVWTIFAELDNPLSPKFDDMNMHALTKMNLTSMDVCFSC